MHSFDGADGAEPLAGLIQAANGNFYGTTLYGGASTNCAYGCGTVFEITPSGTLTTLHSFDGTDGATPYAGLVQTSYGSFYGTTAGGGANNNGMVFKITPSGTLTTLYNFCSKSGCTDGAGPDAGLVQATDGNFYGTTSGGGANNNGTVFKITPSGALTTLHSFAGTDGANPFGGLVQATNGTFYGTTMSGGASTNCSYGCGTVFSLALGLAPFVETLPTFGKVGQRVAILGNTLTGATSVTFNGTPATFTVNPSGSAITTTVPSGATTGKLCVRTPGGMLMSNVAFQVLLTVALSKTSLNFPTQVIGTTSAAETVTLTNTGGTAVAITSIDSSGDFAQTNDCGSGVPPGGSCQISVTFTPSAEGTRTGTVTIIDNAVNSPQTITLKGAGTVVELSPATVDFGNQTVGTRSAPQTIALKNTGSTALSILGMGISGTDFDDFAYTTTCDSSLAAKATCLIHVTFKPEATGGRRASLDVLDNGGGSPQHVMLTGTGT